MRATQVLDELRIFKMALESDQYIQLVQAGYPQGFSADEWAQTMKDLMPVVQAFHVEADMIPLVQFAASTLPEEMRFRPEILPAEVGFCVFQEPLMITDARNRPLTMNALLWSKVATDKMGRGWTGMPGCVFTMLSDVGDNRDSVNAKFAEIYGKDTFRELMRTYSPTRYAFTGMTFLAFGEEIGPPTWGYDVVVDGAVLDRDAIPEDVEATNDHRLVVALWQLMRQTISSVTSEFADRAQARRMGRAQLPKQVTVVTLRHRSTARQEGESLIEYRHRWIVKGHWRLAHCGEGHPNAEWLDGEWRCWTYINPYVKGPDGAPFVQSEKVYNLAR